jgi:hypothetical protein
LNTHVLRCRKCQSRFVLGAVPLDQAATGIAKSLASSHALSPAQSALNGAFAEGSFSGADEDEDDLEAGLPDPSDSQYELPVGVGDEDGAEFNDWSTDDMPARPGPGERRIEAGDSSSVPSDPWYYKFIHAWGRVHFFGAIGFAALSMTVIACLVLARLTGNLKPESSAIAIVVGIVGAIALLMISLSTTALNLLLIDLARNIHRLRVHSDDKSKIMR